MVAGIGLATLSAQRQVAALRSLRVGDEQAYASLVQARESVATVMAACQRFGNHYADAWASAMFGAIHVVATRLFPSSDSMINQTQIGRMRRSAGEPETLGAFRNWRPVGRDGSEQ